MRVFWCVMEGRTDGNFSLNGLHNAGRMDIATRIINAAFWLSGDIRRDVVVYITFLGPPDPPKTVKFVGAEMKRVSPDERNIGAILRRAVSVRADDEWKEVHPGVYVSRLVEEIPEEEGKEVWLLTEEGERAELKEDIIFLLGGKEDVPEKILRRLDIKKRVRIGEKKYMASHVVVVANYLLDGGCK